MDNVNWTNEREILARCNYSGLPSIANNIFLGTFFDSPMFPIQHLNYTTEIEHFRGEGTWTALEPSVFENCSSLSEDGAFTE